MSLSGLKYDDCAYTHKLNESVSSGNYMLDTPRPCNPCFVVSPGVFVGGFGASVCTKDLIDVNSELLNITRPASDCPSKKFLPKVEPLCQPTHFRECDFLTREDTLVSNPKCTGKETTVNRWEWLCRNPQDRAIVPFEFLVNNRTITKDSHRPCLPKPVDQYAGLPSKQTTPCKTYLDEQFNQNGCVKPVQRKQFPIRMMNGCETLQK